MPVAGLMMSVIDAIMNGPEGGDYASITMAGVDPNDPYKIYTMDDGSGRTVASPQRNTGTPRYYDFSERALQWWPETLQDSIDIGWSLKDVGGASHALVQWSSNNGRTISFDVRLSRLMMPVNSRSAKEQFLSYLVRPNSINTRDVRPYNVDIVEQIKFLRGFCYPTYSTVENITIALPPPVMILNIPGLNLNESGGDAIFCIMTGCDVTYRNSFRDGTPRLATVSLTLRQIVQTHAGIKYKGFGDAAPSLYSMAVKEGLDKNSGKGIAGIDPLKVR